MYQLLIGTVNHRSAVHSHYIGTSSTAAQQPYTVAGTQLQHRTPVNHRSAVHSHYIGTAQQPYSKHTATAAQNPGRFILLFRLFSQQAMSQPAADVIAALNKENDDIPLNKILAVLNHVGVEVFMDAESFQSMQPKDFYMILRHVKWSLEIIYGTACCFLTDCNVPDLGEEMDESEYNRHTQALFQIREVAHESMGIRGARAHDCRMLREIVENIQRIATTAK
jgi:hypothetical protein